MHTEIFYTNKIKNEYQIALISDIHFNDKFNRKIFKKILNQIKERQVNYITIAGDILDTSSTTNLDDLKDFFIELTHIAPTIAVLGNHDEKAGQIHNWTYEKNEKLLELLNSIENLHFLNDSNFTDDEITFYGFNLSYHHYEVKKESYETFCEEIEKLKCEIPENTYNITVFHSPINIYTYLKKNKKSSLNKTDLILSGHMHNGCIPHTIARFFNKVFRSTRGFISPRRELFPKYAQGRIYERDGYVYQGIMKLSHSTKSFNKLDFLFEKKVHFIKLKPNKK